MIGAAPTDHTKRTNTAGGVVLSLIVGLGLAACSSTGSTAHTPPPASTPSSSTTPASNSPSASGIQLSSLTHQYEFSETADGGYSSAGTLQFGAPRHADGDDALTAGGVTLEPGTACSINYQTDAIIPAVLTQTGTTSGFSVEGSIELTATNAFLEIDYSDGPQCFDPTTGTGATAGVLTGELADGASSSIPMVFILKNYYSPSAPNGSTEILGQAGLMLVAGHTDDGQYYQLQSVTGPGHISSAGGEYLIPLAGSRVTDNN